MCSIGVLNSTCWTVPRSQYKRGKTQPFLLHTSFQLHVFPLPHTSLYLIHAFHLFLFFSCKTYSDNLSSSLNLERCQHRSFHRTSRTLSLLDNTTSWCTTSPPSVPSPLHNWYVHVHSYAHACHMYKTLFIVFATIIHIQCSSCLPL